MMDALPWLIIGTAYMFLVPVFLSNSSSGYINTVKGWAATNCIIFLVSAAVLAIFWAVQTIIG